MLHLQCDFVVHIHEGPRSHIFCFAFFCTSLLSKLQLEQEILDFSEGLRAIGVKPDEKLALFADNSCRWLIADQGMLLAVHFILKFCTRKLLMDKDATLCSFHCLFLSFFFFPLQAGLLPVVLEVTVVQGNWSKDHSVFYLDGLHIKRCTKLETVRTFSPFTSIRLTIHKEGKASLCRGHKFAKSKGSDCCQRIFLIGVHAHGDGI